MKNKRLKVLLVIEQCNPEWASVPLEGYCFYDQISQLVDVSLVTHERNKPALERVHSDRDITYISESTFIKRYFKVVTRLSKLGNKVIWPLYQALRYPVYGEFNHLVYSKFKDSITRGDYDVVHAITPMMPRYPVKAIRACQNTPFILGPVNGGVSFPKGFRDIARQEFADFNFLRLIGRFIIPGYRETYENSDYILAGSTYTMNLIKSLFNIESSKIELLYENGIYESFLKRTDTYEVKDANDGMKVNLLFVGRLVPYKGADMLIEAISKLGQKYLDKVFLTIVGDGSERGKLEQLVQTFNLKDKVDFAGWVEQKETLKYYRKSDIFCFPSIREFGGAVVLEAMGNGLPCIVINNGGIGEYVTPETGYTIEPLSREYVIRELKRCLENWIPDRKLRQSMAHRAIQRASEFTWPFKAKVIVDTYHKVLAKSV
ncbi:MAG: glycosyltransferase family 4 protein [Leptolyngbyaceae cyanobacterium]